MKKLISLLIVLCLIFALAPAAYADMARLEDLDKDDWKEINETSKYRGNDGIYFFWYGEEGDGIFGADNHLLSCTGDCNCAAILTAAEKEYAAEQAKQRLRVWISSDRGDDLVRHDLVVGEITPPYNVDSEDENQDYLDAKPELSEVLEDFYDDRDLNEELYRATGFIHTQVKAHLGDIENNRRSGESHVEYRLMNGAWSIEVPGIDFFDSSTFSSVTAATSLMPSSTCFKISACSSAVTLEFCAAPAKEVISLITSSNATAVAAVISLPFSISATVFSISSLVLTAAWALSVASLPIWSATTAKPRPASPALAASMEAFNANRLVWSAISSIAVIIFAISSEISLICCISS